MRPNILPMSYFDPLPPVDINFVTIPNFRGPLGGRGPWTLAEVEIKSI